MCDCIAAEVKVNIISISLNVPDENTKKLNQLSETLRKVLQEKDASAKEDGDASDSDEEEAAQMFPHNTADATISQAMKEEAGPINNYAQYL